MEEADFSNPLFVLPILVGPVFILCGVIQWRYPPKNINPMYGYRTKVAMKNIASWNFAQTYSAKWLTLLGIIFTASSTVGLFVKMDEDFQVLIGILLTGLVAVTLYLLTEKKLKENFGGNAD